MLGNTTERWGAVAMLLHWGIAAVIFFQFGLGLYMKSLGLTPQAYTYFQLHKSLGILVLALVVVRLAWRLVGPVPVLPAEMPGWEALAAKAGHLALYGLILVIPVTGWLVASASSLPTQFFGQFDLPRLVAVDRDIEARAGGVHALLAWILAVVVAGHILAALKHHFIDRNAILVRMLPGRGSRS